MENEKLEIKFRGKRVDNGEWVYGGLLYSGEDFFIVEKFLCRRDSNGCDIFSSHRVIPNSVGQYTGLKDKDGKEIYGGDFLKLIDKYRGKGEQPSYVIFKHSQWMMQGTMHYTHVDSINNYCLDKMELIGNIYENPELLKTE